jgi:hypothetical protein
MIDYLLNNPILLQQYIKTTKKWNSYSFNFVAFPLEDITNSDNDYIPSLTSDRRNNVLFIGRFYGIVPNEQFDTIFGTSLNDKFTNYIINQHNQHNSVVNIDIPLIIDGISLQITGNLNFNFMGYLFYSN